MEIKFQWILFGSNQLGIDWDMILFLPMVCLLPLLVGDLLLVKEANMNREKKPHIYSQYFKLQGDLLFNKKGLLKDNPTQLWSSKTDGFWWSSSFMCLQTMGTWSFMRTWSLHMDLRTLRLQEKYNKNIIAYYRVLGTSTNRWEVSWWLLTEIFNMKHGSSPPKV